MVSAVSEQRTPVPQINCAYPWPGKKRSAAASGGRIQVPRCGEQQVVLFANMQRFSSGPQVNLVGHQR